MNSKTDIRAYIAMFRYLIILILLYIYICEQYASRHCDLKVHL